MKDILWIYIFDAHHVANLESIEIKLLGRKRITRKPKTNSLQANTQSSQ